MKREAVWWGLALVAIGGFSLLRVLGHEWASMYTLWPLILVGGGTASLVGGIQSRQQGSLWFGVLSAASGALFLYVTLAGGQWGLLQRVWPMFLGFAALGWLAVWIVGPRRASTLVLAALAALGCLLGAQYVAGALDGKVAEAAQRLWPLAFVVLGAAILLDYLFWRRYADRD